MEKLLLLADEAIALGALDGGLSGVYAYPGTPSTEITEYIQQSPQGKASEVHCKWSANEKTAMEAAVGLSFVGKRAMVCMKHVGLNVAADPFMNAAVTGINGGLIVLSADDPSMHSSQNEQDSRFYGKFALIPVLEPSNQQEAYDMAYEGLELSEKLGRPILLRITTRLAHSRSGVVRKPCKPQNAMKMPANKRQFILLPAIARGRYAELLASQDKFQDSSENSVYNTFTDGGNKQTGIIAAGIGYNYLMENFPQGCPYPVLKVGQYPLPLKPIEKMVAECESIMVIEEGYPLIEDAIRGMLPPKKPIIRGRGDGSLPRQGELNPDIVAKDEVYRVANWLFGCHPYHNYSLVATVGATRPKAVFYGNNRADFSFIPGNVAPGLLFRHPDHFENYDDWPFLWGQNEGTIGGNTAYLIFGHAFKDMVSNEI